MTQLTLIGLWIGFIGMVIGTVIFGQKAVAMRRKEGMEFPLKSFFIVLWAGALYLTMILGETVTPVKGQTVFWGRYVDWVVTTPVLLLDLAVIAGLRPKLIAGVIAADIFMILTGLVATLEAPPTSYLWYIISCGAFIAILASLLTEFTASAARRNVRVNNLFLKLRNYLIVLWICYPIVWLLGAEAFKIIPTGVEVIIYAIIDIAAKVGFGLILTSAAPEILAQASNSESFMEAVHSYMRSGERERDRSYTP